MIFVYVLGKVEAGTENEVLNSLKSINQVRKASLTYGIYDLCIEALFQHQEEARAKRGKFLWNCCT